MNFGIPHLMMAVSTISLMSIFGYMNGHINGIVTYQIILGAVGTSVLTVMYARFTK